jgi:membrane protein involved in D-alanine export
LSSGPIDRSRRFKKDTDAIPSRKEYLNLLGTGLQKLFLGAVYKFVVSSFLFSKLGDVTGITGCSSLIKYIYTYGFFLFFDFAGYSLMAVGASYIFGIKTPDNFNKPFLSVDVRDFWNRWHITLSHWLRDFVFSRFIMNCMRKKWFSSRLLTAVLGLMLNMLIMGLWHGFSLCYVLYGVYHGVLLSVFEIYQKKSKFYKNNKNKFIYKLASWFITINLVMIGFMIFSLASYDKVILSWIYQKLT